MRSVIVRVNEPVHVELSPRGAPAHFVWRGYEYHVVSTPEPWLAQQRWWSHDAARAPRGGGVHEYEQERWRVDAVALSPAAPAASEGSFDLAVDAARSSWLLADAFTDEFEELLFLEP